MNHCTENFEKREEERKERGKEEKRKYKILAASFPRINQNFSLLYTYIYMYPWQRLAYLPFLYYKNKA